VPVCSRPAARFDRRPYITVCDILIDLFRSYLTELLKIVETEKKRMSQKDVKSSILTTSLPPVNLFYPTVTSSFWLFAEIRINQV
jgi:hypothetical protein